MTALRVLIADDEQMARKRLHRLLAAIPDIHVAGEAASGQDVLDRVRAAPDIDVILLDIHMPGLSGTDTLGLLGSDGPLVVFTTAHADHALTAFDGGAVDYVLKPIEPARLVRALDRARERLGARRGGQAAPARFALPTRRGVILLDPEDIGLAVIDGASVRLVTRRGTFFTDLRLSDLEARLPSAFVRVHRQAIVHLGRVERLEDADSGGYVAVLDDGARVAVSRQVARRLRRTWAIG